MFSLYKTAFTKTLIESIQANTSMLVESLLKLVVPVLKLAVSPTKLRRAMMLFSAVALLLTPAAHAAPPPPPAISVSGDIFAPKLVKITESDTTIYYTTDGSTPTTSSSVFSTPFTLTSSCVVKAIAVDANGTSSVASENVDVPIVAFESDSGVTTASGNPPPVVSWDDLSGNSNDATGSTNAKPLLRNNAINSLPAISFDGKFFELPSGFADFSNGISLFVITKPKTTTASAHVLDLSSGGTGNNILLRISSSGSKAEFGVYSGTSSSTAQSAAALNADQYQLIEAILVPGSPNGTGTVYVNGSAGTPVTTMFNAPNLTRNSNYLGQANAGGNYYPGTVAAIALFPNAVLTQKKIRSYLLQKYQILNQQPATPKISVAAGTLSGPTQVVINSEPNTLVFITTDGSTPTTGSKLYDGCPITINYSQTLKAIAIKNGVSSPGVASEAYVLDPTQWPALNSSDTTAPTINLTLPTPSVP